MKRARIERITAELSALVDEITSESPKTMGASAVKQITLGRIQAINDILEKLDATFTAEDLLR